MITNKPKVTVLMPVFNSDKYIKKSIESILNQSFADFEFLIINDGSTDSSAKIIKSFTDARIKYIENENNLGIVETLNKGLGLARGEYIARMDSDDISLPERFIKQTQFMDKFPDVAVCGSWVRNFGTVHSISKLPIDNEQAAIMLIFDNAIAHPASMIRRSALPETLYRTEYIYAEDYDLWARLSLSWKISNIPEVLLKYRVHHQQISQKKSSVQNDVALKIQINLISSLFGLMPTVEDLAAHRLLTSYGARLQKKSLDEVEHWLMKLVKMNEDTEKFNRRNFNVIVEKYWKNFCMRDGSLGIYVFKRCVGLPLYQNNKRLDLSILSLLARSSAYSVWHYLQKISKIKLFQ